MRKCRIGTAKFFTLLLLLYRTSVNVHNLVSKVGAGDAGAEFLRRAGEYALSINKKYLRLDSSEDNEPLARYYEKLGFVPAGTCTDGPYKGIRREKKLK